MKATNNELEQLENRYWQAIKDQDAQTCADLCHDPCMVTGAQGVGYFTRAEMLAMMKQERPYTLDEFKLTDVKTSMLTPDVGIVAYTVHENITVEGKPIAISAADSSTWVRRDGTWTCAMHSESILGDMFGRDKVQAGVGESVAQPQHTQP